MNFRSLLHGLSIRIPSDTVSGDKLDYSALAGVSDSGQNRRSCGQSAFGS